MEKLNTNLLLEYITDDIRGLRKLLAEADAYADKGDETAVARRIQSMRNYAASIVSLIQENA